MLRLFQLNLFYIIFPLGFYFSCSKKEEDLREIRGHSLYLNGVAHATPVNRAGRYCYKCHGTGLTGGENFEPSCFQCHGENWLESDPESNLAPQDHTIKLEDWLHHSDVENSVSTCGSCHGTSLEGTETTASCFLCHVQVW